MDIVDFISAERLKKYETQTDSVKRAIALHNHTLQLGSSLMSMIALLELSLRNSTNHCLSRDFADNDWLLPGSTTLPLKPLEQKAVSTATSHARKAAYSKLSHQEKVHLDVFAFPGGVPNGTSHKNRVRKRQAFL